MGEFKYTNINAVKQRYINAFNVYLSSELCGFGIKILFYSALADEFAKPVRVFIVRIVEMLPDEVGAVCPALHSVTLYNMPYKNADARIILNCYVYNKGGKIMSDSYEDIIEDNEEEEVNAGIVKYDITTSTDSWNPGNIVEFIDNGMIEIPIFQRNFVWKKDMSSKLIESILLGLPVPEIFVYNKDVNEPLKIIDGQQRLLSIYFFMKGRFPKNLSARDLIRKNLAENSLGNLITNNSLFNDFRIDFGKKDNRTTTAGMPEYLNKSYGELSPRLQAIFKLRRNLRVITIRQNIPEYDESSMFEIFNRLNTGGEKLEHQEIRASLYYCYFYKMMLELNEDENWRKLFSNKESRDLHSKDVEVILRAFAMLEWHHKYSPRMVDFLNDYSAYTKSLKKEEIKFRKELFLSFINSCSEIIDKRLFLRNNKFSPTVFEAVFVAVCEDAFKEKHLINGKLNADSLNIMLQNEDFIRYTGRASAGTENVKQRIDIARRLVRLEEK